MKKIILFLALSLFCAGLVRAEETLVGSYKSNRYHRPDCRYVKKIDAINLRFFDTSEEAEKLNYKSCKICKPGKISINKPNTNPIENKVLLATKEQ